MNECRIFTGWDRPALQLAAELLADRYAAGDQLALRACIVVVPGARAGRRLKELLVDVALERKLRLVPPHITTIGHLPELLHAAAVPAADGAVSRRAWARALRRTPPERLRQLHAQTPDTDDLRAWLAIARRVQQLHRDVAAAGHTFRDVASRCSAGLAWDDAARWNVLAAVQDAYTDELERSARGDRELMRIAATRARAIACDADLWLLAVAEMPLVVRRMIEGLPPDRVHAVVHAPPQLAAAFDALGCVEPGFWREAGVPVLDKQLAVVDRPADQAAAVLSRLAELDGMYAADDIVVGVPDEEVVAVLEERLADGGVPARHAVGTRMEATAPYRLLEAVADVLDSDSAEAWAALFRHPDLGRWLRRHARGMDHRGAPVLRAGDAALTHLDRYLGRSLQAQLRHRLPGSDRDGRHAVEAMLEIVRSRALAGRLRGRRSLGEWMPDLLGLLLQVYGDRPLVRQRPRERRLLDACRFLRDAAAELNRVPPALDDDRCDAAAAIRVLLDDTRGVRIPAEPDRAAVELLGWLELHLDDAPVAIITGVNEPFLPESVNADAFLPDSLRSVLGLEDNARRYARDAYQLTAVLHSRPHVHVIAGRHAAAGDPLRPSRLLLAAFGEPLARRVRAFYGDRSEASEPVPMNGTAATASGVRTDEAVSGFMLPPEPVLRAAQPIEQIPVTAFRALLQDPYMFVLERMLRPTLLDDHARELDPLQYGGLAHSVLEAFGRSDEVRSADNARVAECLQLLLSDHMSRRFGTHVRTAVRLQLEQLRMRLRAFARWHAGRIAAGWHVVGVECRTTDEGVPFTTDGTPIRLTGRIDRIDYNERTRRWAVFDYKTGDRAESPESTHRRGRGADAEWVDLQLPMYRHILPFVVDAAGVVVFTGSLDDVDLGYICLGADVDAIGEQMAKWDRDQLADADEAARACVRLLRANRFVFDPARTASYLDADTEALLGRNRLVLEDDDEDVDAGA